MAAAIAQLYRAGGEGKARKGEPDPQPSHAAACPARHWREKRSLQQEPTGQGRILPKTQGGEQPSPPAAGAPLPAGQEARVAGLCPRKRRGAAREGAPGERLPAAAPPRPAPSCPGAEQFSAGTLKTGMKLGKSAESQVTGIQTQVFGTAGVRAHQQQGMRCASRSPTGLPGCHSIRGENTHFFAPKAGFSPSLRSFHN